jgi:hypothetical protein
MFRFILLILGAGLAGLVACATPAVPTPIIIVVTATPQAGAPTPLIPPTTPSPAASATPGTAETPAAVDTTTVTLKPTTVKYVLAKQDINIRKGPGTEFEIVGGVYAGQTAQVTGYKSADEQWWRVVCPVDTVTDCWVSADTALTEPTDTPNTGPTATTTTEVSVEGFTRQLATALQAKDYPALEAMMEDPFTIGHWRSEGTSPTRADALKLLRESWVGPASAIVVDLADKTDQSALLDGTPPLSMWDPKIKTVKSVYVKGLNADGKGEGLAVIARREDGSLYWYALLYAGGGFK